MSAIMNWGFGFGLRRVCFIHDSDSDPGSVIMKKNIVVYAGIAK